LPKLIFSFASEFTIIFGRVYVPLWRTTHDFDFENRFSICHGDKE
jgi:hypothetical protein